jgi:hypothetical protein
MVLAFLGRLIRRVGRAVGRVARTAGSIVRRFAARSSTA